MLNWLRSKQKIYVEMCSSLSHTRKAKGYCVCVHATNERVFIVLVFLSWSRDYVDDGTHKMNIMEAICFAEICSVWYITPRGANQHIFAL